MKKEKGTYSKKWIRGFMKRTDLSLEDISGIAGVPLNTAKTWYYGNAAISLKVYFDLTRYARENGLI
jgi:hypothetical protein